MMCLKSISRDIKFVIAQFILTITFIIFFMLTLESLELKTLENSTWLTCGAAWSILIIKVYIAILKKDLWDMNVELMFHSQRTPRT